MDDGSARGVATDDSIPEPWSGDFEPLPFAPGLRKGEVVRLMTGGVCVLDGGLLGRLIEGWSHDEKKSSPGPAGVVLPSVGVATTSSVITTSSGYLDMT